MTKPDDFKKENLQVMAPSGLPVERRAPTPIDILQSAVSGGITAENVEVVERLAQMCREQRAEATALTFRRDNTGRYRHAR